MIETELPLVSVIIPTFNRSDMLPEALESVAEQTHPRLEIIVVDDGSIDETAVVVRHFREESGTEVEYHRQENAGCAVARNTGIALARGEWLLFLDSDDMLEPGAVRALLKTALACGADFVYAPALELLPNGRVELNRPVAAGHPADLAEEHFFDTNVRNGAVLYRSTILRELGGFDPALKHNEDSDLLQRVALRYRAAYTDIAAVRHRHHSGSKSLDRVKIQRALLESAGKVLREHPHFRDRLGQRASERMAELRRGLVRELVLRGRLQEARRESGESIALLDRLSISLGSALPGRLAAGLRKFAHRLRQRLGMLLRRRG